LTLDKVPLTFGGQIGFQVENTLAAVGAAVSMGVPAELIRARAESFACDMNKVPGRFNIIEVNGATAVIDYGHNPHALLAILDALKNFPQQYRSCVYSMAGDRRDCDLVRAGEILGDAFDRVILYEDHYCRGRATGEIIALMRQGMAAGKRVKAIEEVQGAVKSVERALQSARQGELLLIQADAIDETVTFVRQYLDSLAAQTAEQVGEDIAEPADAAVIASEAAEAVEEVVTSSELSPSILSESQAAAKA
jgi:cyanophycin synthetase